jgi:regulator of sigma E protease
MSLPAWFAAVAVLLGVLILVHELGHFVFAKIFDVKVLRFSLGFGPRLLGFTHGDTEYQLSLVPLGGYVRLLGEDPGEPIPPIDRPRALAAKPLWQRYTVVIAGPMFNLLLPLLIYFVHYAGQRTLLPPTIGTVLPDQPAAAAGLLPGDRVESVDGRRVRYWEELERRISDSAGKTMRFAIRRGPDAEERDVTPIEIERTGALRVKERVGWIGVSPRFHLPEIGVLDPASPAAQAGLKTFDFVTAVNGVPVGTWTEFSRAVERAGASPLRLNYLRGGYSAVAFSHIEIEEPGSAVVIPVAAFDAAGRRRCSCSRSSRAAPRTASRCGAAIRSKRSTAPRSRTGISCASAWPPSPTAASASAGSRPAASGARPASARSSARSWTPTARKNSTSCSARSTAWPGRPTRRCRSRTASATRSATASSARARSSPRWPTGSARSFGGTSR